MKNYPPSRVRALAARFGSKVLAQYLSAAPSEVEALKSGKKRATAKQVRALGKLSGSGRTEKKLLRLSPVALATQAGVSLATAKKWQKSGSMGTSTAARALLLNTHALGGKVGGEPVPKTKWQEEHYQGHTTRGHAWKIDGLGEGVLLTEQTLGAIRTWLESVSVPQRWTGRGASVLITGIADCYLTTEQVGPGSRGVVVKMRGKKEHKLESFVVSSGKQPNKRDAISEFIRDTENALDYQTTLKKLEIKVYRDK